MLHKRTSRDHRESNQWSQFHFAADSRLQIIELSVLYDQEQPRDTPAVSNEEVTASPAAAVISKNEQEAFSSPIKKRKLSPPKKAPERYLEDAPQRRNSVQKKEAADTRHVRQNDFDCGKQSTHYDACQRAPNKKCEFQNSRRIFVGYIKITCGAESSENCETFQRITSWQQKTLRKSVRIYSGSIGVCKGQRIPFLARSS